MNAYRKCVWQLGAQPSLSVKAFCTMVWIKLNLTSTRSQTLRVQSIALRPQFSGVSEVPMFSVSSSSHTRKDEINFTSFIQHVLWIYTTHIMNAWIFYDWKGNLLKDITKKVNARVRYFCMKWFIINELTFIYRLNSSRTLFLLVLYLLWGVRLTKKKSCLIKVTLSLTTLNKNQVLISTFRERERLSIQ